MKVLQLGLRPFRAAALREPPKSCRDPAPMGAPLRSPSARPLRDPPVRMGGSQRHPPLSISPPFRSSPAPRGATRGGALPTGGAPLGASQRGHHGAGPGREERGEARPLRCPRGRGKSIFKKYMIIIKIKILKKKNKISDANDWNGIKS